MPQNLPRSGPLQIEHQAAGAKFGDFAGWSMPLEFADGGVIAEHNAVRSTVGMFDVSHMGTFLVTGPGAKGGLNEILTNDLDRISPGQAQYSLLCNDSGGVVDDLFVYLVSDERAVVVPNASNASVVVATVERVLESRDVRVEDWSERTAIIAVQGPRSADVLLAVGLSIDLCYLDFKEQETDFGRVLVARTGYTGEHGYELLVETQFASHWWRALAAQVGVAGGRVCGLGARDTLRTEMGYALHGHELGLTINPVEAGLSWAIGWDKVAFPGLGSLKRERAAGPQRCLVGLRFIDRGVPRPDMVVRASAEADAVLGKITSGTFSPTLREGIALALLDCDVAVGDEVSVDVRGRACRAVVCRAPFVDSNPRN